MGIMSEDPTTDELLARWRQAEQDARALDRTSAAWKAARFLADQAWQDYERRLNGDLSARQDKRSPSEPNGR